MYKLVQPKHNENCATKSHSVDFHRWENCGELPSSSIVRRILRFDSQGIHFQVLHQEDDMEEGNHVDMVPKTIECQD